MKYVNKLAIVLVVLTPFCTQAYAAGFAKFDGMNGEAMSAKEQTPNLRANLGSISKPLGMGSQPATERRVDRMPARTDMKWDNVRNHSWQAGSTGGANDRPTEEVSFYFNKIPAAQPLPRPAPNQRITDPGKPQPISLLIPAVQKVR